MVIGWRSLGLKISAIVVAVLWSPFLAQAEEAEGPTPLFVAVPAERSGLTHPLNSDLEKYGKIDWPWISPAVDINADGHNDILVYGHHGGGGAVWLGRGDGTFALDERGYLARWAFRGRDPIWLDLNGNGAMDGIGTEHVERRVFLNDGAGHWSDTGLRIGGMLIDTNGDGRIDGVWESGELRRMDPPLHTWGSELPAKLTFTTVWNAEKSLGWPEGMTRGRFGGWREAYAVDLDGDHRNELIVNVQGAGFHTREIATWALTRGRGADGEEDWIDVTAERGLPTGIGHCLIPEDVDVDGHLDLVDVETGEWHRNDGRGRFSLSPSRFYDPATYKVGRKSQRPWSPDNDLDWVDLDNNGYRDLVTGTMHHSGEVSGGAFLNLGGGRFIESTEIPRSRGRKFADFSGSGRLDMIRLEEKSVQLYANQTPHRGLHVKLVPRNPAEGPLGAKVWVYESGALGAASKLVHYRQCYMQQRPHRSNVLGSLHVGIGERTAVDVRVRFPSGEVREVRGAKGATTVEVRE